MKILILNLFFFLTLPVFAYIPNVGMILDRVAVNHGSGLYFVEQEVILPADPKPLVIKEQWLIENENSMRVRITGQKELEGQLDMTFIYNFNKKFFVNSSGQTVSSNIDEHFIEPLFYFRKTNFIKSKILNNNMVPRKIFDNLLAESTEHSHNTYLNLSRVGGSISYLIGKPSLSEKEIHPGVWIEQDQFHLTKFRFSDNIEISANEYNRHNNGLYLPNKRSIRWGDRIVQINLLQVSTSSSTLKPRLVPKSFDVKKEPHLINKSPDVAVVNEFYQLFR